MHDLILAAATDPVDVNTKVTFLQTIIVAALVFGGQFVVARLSNKAQGKDTEVDSQSKATDAWQKYAEEMKNRLDHVETRLAASEEASKVNAERIKSLEMRGMRDADLIRRLVLRLRAAMREINRLGGSVPEEDHELTDLADIRLTRPDPH